MTKRRQSIVSSLSLNNFLIHLSVCLSLFLTACSLHPADVHSEGYIKASLCNSLRPPPATGDALTTGENLLFSGSESFDHYQFDAEQRVANGRESTKGEGGAVVSLHIRLSDRRSIGCTGSRISAKWVLTAAHCFFDPKNEGLAVRTVTVANNSLHKYTGEIVTGRAYCHADYGFRQRYYENDIALVKLGRPVKGPTMALVRKTDLPTKDSPSPQLVTILGYGKLAPDKDADVLMAGEVFTAPSSRRCTRASAYEKTFCTTTVGPDGVLPSSLCPGDSGGPALVRSDDGVARQVGVNSFIRNIKSDEKATCGRAGNISAFVDVWHYRSWIAKIAGI